VQHTSLITHLSQTYGPHPISLLLSALLNSYNSISMGSKNKSVKGIAEHRLSAADTPSA